MKVNFDEDSIESLKVQVSELDSEITTLKVQLKTKENGWNKERAILQQNIELQDLQIKESKTREDNFRKMNETFMETLSGLSSDSSKFSNKSLKELKGMLEGMNSDSEQNKIKRSDLITKLENESLNDCLNMRRGECRQQSKQFYKQNRELKDQLHERQLEIQKESLENEKVILKLQGEIKDLNQQNQNLQAAIKRQEEDKKQYKDLFEQDAQVRVTELLNSIEQIKQECEQDIQNNATLNEQRILQIKELYEKERYLCESKLIKTKDNIDSQSLSAAQSYIEEQQINHSIVVQQLQLQIQNLRTTSQQQEQQTLKKVKDEYEQKLQEMQDKFKTFKTKSKTNEQNIKMMKEKLEKQKQDIDQINQLQEQNKKLKSKNKQINEQVKKLEQAENKLKDQLIEKNHIIEEEKMGNTRKENIIRNMQEQAVSIIQHDQSNFITENDLNISQFQLRQNHLLSAAALNSQLSQNVDGLAALNPQHQTSQGGISSHQQSYNQHFKSISESDFQQIIQHSQNGSDAQMQGQQQTITNNNNNNFRSTQQHNTEELPKRSANKMQQRLQGGNNPLAGQIIQRGQSKNINSPEAKSQQLSNQQHMLQFQQLQQQPLLFKQNSNNNLFSSNNGAILNPNQNALQNNTNNIQYKSISNSNSNLVQSNNQIQANNLGQVNNQSNRTNQSGIVLTSNQDVMMYTQNSQNNYTEEDTVNIQNQNNMNCERPLQSMTTNPILGHSSSVNSMSHSNSTHMFSNNLFQNNPASNSQISMPQTVQSRNLCEGCRIGAKNLFSQQRVNLSVPSRQQNGQKQQQQQISHHQQSCDDDQQYQLEIEELRQQVDNLTTLVEDKTYENEQLKYSIQILEQQLERITESRNESLLSNQTQIKEIEQLREALTSTTAEKRKKEENETILKQEIKYLVDKLLKAKEKIEEQQADQQQQQAEQQHHKNNEKQFQQQQQQQLLQQQQNAFKQAELTDKKNETCSQDEFTEDSQHHQQLQQYHSNQNNNIRHFTQENNSYLTNQPNSPKINIHTNNHSNSSTIFSEANQNIRSSTVSNKFNLDQNLANKYGSVQASNYNSTQGHYSNTDMTPSTHLTSKIQQSLIIKNSQLATSVNMSQMLNQSSCINQSLCLNGSTKSPGFLNFIHQNKENSSFQTRKNDEKILFGGFEKSPTSNFNLGKSTDQLQNDSSKQKGFINSSQYLNNQSQSFINNFNSNSDLEFQNYNKNVGQNMNQNNQSSYRTSSQNHQFTNNLQIQSQQLQSNQSVNICRSERKGQSNLKSMIQKEQERGLYLRSKTPFTSRFNQSLDKHHIQQQDTQSTFEQTKKQLFPPENNHHQLKNPLKTLQQQQMRRLDIPKSKPSYLFD